MIKTERYQVTEHIDYSEVKRIVHTLVSKLNKRYNMNVRITYHSKSRRISYKNNVINLNMNDIHIQYYRDFNSNEYKSLRKLYSRTHREYDVITCIIAHEYAHALAHARYDCLTHQKDFKRCLKELIALLDL
jgi:hypothetical protein